MPLFNVAVREHTYTGRFYSDVVQAGSREEALQVAAQHAAVPRPPGPEPQQGSDVTVPGDTCAGRLDADAVRASRREEAVQVAAAPEPPPGPTPQAEAAGRATCADVWVYALLHCELEAGHDSPHMAVARGYRRPVRWVRDDLGIAHAVPAPATNAPVVSPVTQPSPAPEAEPPEEPFTGAAGS